jgi:hypothetical protein
MANPSHFEHPTLNSKAVFRAETNLKLTSTNMIATRPHQYVKVFHKPDREGYDDDFRLDFPDHKVRAKPPPYTLNYHRMDRCIFALHVQGICQEAAVFRESSSMIRHPLLPQMLCALRQATIQLTLRKAPGRQNFPSQQAPLAVVCMIRGGHAGTFSE